MIHAARTWSSLAAQVLCWFGPKPIPANLPPFDLFTPVTRPYPSVLTMGMYE